MQLRLLCLLAMVSTFLLGRPSAVRAEIKLSDAEIEALAEEAFVYAFPLVMNYGVVYEYFVDAKSPQYKAPFNHLYNTARVYTPADTSIVTPNSDTPYSFVCGDLRAEPIVFTIPPIEKDRYFSVQLIDFYTFNYGYIGSRTTGNGGGNYMIAGPGWTGETPKGIDKVFRSETDFSTALIRTQLFSADDLENVKKIQQGYKAQTLSAFLKQPAPKAAPEIHWPKIDKELAAKDPFAYLNFYLTLCPAVGPAAVEKPLREKFAKLGIVAGQPFPIDQYSPTQKEALVRGAKRGLEAIKESIRNFGEDENGWRVGSPFGDRAFFKGDWLKRAGSAMAGIYGNDAVEALYPMLAHDSDGQKLDCSKNRYTLTFPAGEEPPCNAFWSVTMYDGKTQLLIENPINRYLINSPMLPGLKKNADGSLTIYLQTDSPGKDKESNWLPAPDGPPYIVMRLYWPEEAALTGAWKPPAVVRVK